MQNPKEVRAFRLSRDVLKMLRIAAHRHGITENALAEEILARSLEIDALVQAFDYISFSRETFTSILGLTDAHGLETIGDERGRKAFSLAKELFETNDLELEFPQYLSKILGKEARWFRVEGTNAKPERITLLHSYGEKWSEFLESYLSSAYGAISRSELGLVATRDYVSVQFPRIAP